MINCEYSPANVQRKDIASKYFRHFFIFRLDLIALPCHLERSRALSPFAPLGRDDSMISMISGMTPGITGSVLLNHGVP